VNRIPEGFADIGSRAGAWAVQTPAFVYDRAIVSARIARLRAALPGGVDIHYAMKANPLPELVKWMSEHIDGIDVASSGELAVALNAGVAGARISFAGPGKRDGELSAAAAAGATINLESEGELSRLLALGVSARVAIRINPPFDIRGSGMKMGGGARPFGVDADKVPAMLATITASHLDFDGFQVFAGSQNLSAEAIIAAQAQTLDLVASFGVRPRRVNLGGGFGLPYFPGDVPLDVEAVGKALGEKLAARSEMLSDTRFVIELGRWLVGEAGVYLTRVVDVKTSYGETFVVVDGGLHHQLAASGNFGTVIRRNYPVANVSRLNEPRETTVNVVGCLCTPLDRLGEKVAFPTTEVGDIVAVFMAGAYGLTASPTAFLGHPAAVELLV
jgi:diaminopimelate decarboxylase